MLYFLKRSFRFLQAILFCIIFVIFSLVLLAALIVATPFGNKNVIRKISGIWAKSNIVVLKYICGLDYRVEGEENLPKNDYGYLVVSKHQSTWETYFLYYYFKNYAAFVLKKQLLYIPIFGWGLYNTEQIYIERKDGISAIKKIVKQARFFMEQQKRKVVIFPQGTRVPVGKTPKEYPYKAGFVAMINDLKCDVLPIALNTGVCWGKGHFIKTPGTIVIKILPMVKYTDIQHLKKDEMIKYFQDIIEPESSKLAE